MLNTINSDLIRGNINTIILKALFEGDRYGYDIIKEIEQKSSGQYKLKQPTLYSCLKRLEVQGFVRSYWGAKTVGGIGGRRKYYTLTDMGREIFLKNQTDWEYSRTVIDRLISDKSYDLANLKTFGNEELIEDSENTPDIDLEGEFNDESASSENAENSVEEVALPPVEEDLVMDMSMVISDVAKTIHAEHTSPPPTQNENSTTININNYIDPSTLIKDLFNNEQNQNSYYEHAKSQNYSEPNETETDEPKITTKEYIEQLIEEKFSLERATNKTIVEENTVAAPSNEVRELSVTDEPQPQNSSLPFGQDFISYHQKNNTPLQTDRTIIEREYKDALALLFKNNDENDHFAPPPTPHTIILPTTQDNSQIHTRDSLFQMRDTGIKVQTTHLTSTRHYENTLENNLTKIAETARHSGDNIQTRIHDGEVALLYEAKYYYFSNKLMIRQSLISFLLATASVFFAFLIVQFGAGGPTPPNMPNLNLVAYLLGFLTPLVFPIVSAVMYLLNPEKLKRVDYSLKSSMAFRTWVVILLLIITYCVNLFMGMSPGFQNGNEYLSTLLIPIFLILNLPISGLVFYAFYSSKKFHQYK